MAVYNGEKFLEQAIDSILLQTFAEFELLIINDGSTDRTDEIIRNYQDSRLTYIINTQNIGCVLSLNKGLSLAKTDLIARMDADDISEPTRLEKQFNFLRDNPEIDIVGSHINFIDETSKKIGSHIYPISNNEIKASVLFGSPFAHPCVMFRNEKFKALDLVYRQEYHYAEDYDLWQRVLTELNGANYDEILLDYRISSSQVSNKHYHHQQIADKKIKINALRTLGLNLQTISYLDIFLQDAFEPTQAKNFNYILSSLSELLNANRRLKIYDNNILEIYVVLKLEKIITFYTCRTFKLFQLYRKSELYKYNRLSVASKLKCFFKQLIKI